MFERFFPDEYVASTYVIPFEKLYEEGYRGVIFDIDNTLVPHGAPADERAKKLFVGTKYICNAHKPSTRNYIRAMELMGTDRSNTLFVGDQLFTDVWGAKRAGMRNILVKPIHPKEEIQIVLKRRLEAVVLHFYKKRLKNKGN